MEQERAAMAEVTYFVSLPFVATDDLLLPVNDPYAPILQNCFSQRHWVYPGAGAIAHLADRRRDEETDAC
jgi:hypothetical protein